MMIWPVRADNIVDFWEDWIWKKLTATVIWSIFGKAKNWVKTKRVIFLCGQFLRFVCKSSNSDGLDRYPLDHAGIVWIPTQEKNTKLGRDLIWKRKIVSLNLLSRRSRKSTNNLWIVTKTFNGAKKHPLCGPSWLQ